MGRPAAAHERPESARPVVEVMVVDLDDHDARLPEVSGSKAACLAAARAHGLRVLPGFAVTTAAHARFLRADHTLPRTVSDQLAGPWARLSHDGTIPLVVRSSSTVEDVGESSMAGRFCSVLDVRGWRAFLAAVLRVFASADAVADQGARAQPIGVLVQPQLNPRVSGVMFGVDPVTGERRVVVEAVPGSPDALVSGRVVAQRYVLSPRGRLVEGPHQHSRLLEGQPGHGALLSRPELLRLAYLARRAARAFGSAQDVEWALDDDDVVLLQSRPVTATATPAAGTSPVLGPGPVAETFPDPLGRLEVDLWVAPLRSGVTSALAETRATSRRHLHASPVVATINGRVAADLELFGYVPRRRGVSALDPRRTLRRLAAAWHVGRLRVELPARASALVQEVDTGLSGVVLVEQSDTDLIDLVQRCCAWLERLHHDEVLAGTMLTHDGRNATAPAVALANLARARASGIVGATDLLRRFPELLALYPPAVGAAPALPPAPAPPEGDDRVRTAAEPAATPAAGLDDLGLREQLRLRSRWVQELSARAAWELGRRLAARGVLPEPGAVTLLDLSELSALASGCDGLPEDLAARQSEELRATFSAPLPTMFRVAPDGSLVPCARRGARPGAGVGAGGGRGVGPVVHGSVRHPPAPGDVLVVRDLAPGLAPYLPGLAGLVAESGGALSHLAILAREAGVPTVVAMHDALARFPVGLHVVVDGQTGEVAALLGEGG